VVSQVHFFAAFTEWGRAVIFLLLITAIGLRVLFDAPRLIFLLVAMVALIRTLNFFCFNQVYFK